MMRRAVGAAGRFLHVGKHPFASLVSASAAKSFALQHGAKLVSFRALSSVNMYNDDTINPGKIRKVLIANRGEIACRVIQTLKKYNVKTVAVYSDADAKAAHVEMADEAYRLGPAASKESYLLSDRILDIAEACGAQAIHPGYGFLSENERFADACARRDVKFMGPPSSAIQAMGCKRASKEVMEKAGVPVVPGYHGEEQDEAFLQSEADRIGYPLLIKAEKGGGGKGMRVVNNSGEFKAALEAAQREAINSFGDGRVLLERFLVKPRHIEVQVFADQHKNYVYLFERDCSVQRRHQKVLEESPAPGISEGFRKRIGEAAVAAAAAVGYEGAGTVEFIVDTESLKTGEGEFYFMEMNTRLQVEHPVTEMVTKKDLVALQLHVAAGNPLPFSQSDLQLQGHAIEARIYAESPENNFLPQTGTVHHLKPPSETENVRVDTGVRQGDEVSVFYDPMIAKLIVWDKDRDAALRRLTESLNNYEIVGLKNNIDFVNTVANHFAFSNGDVSTDFIEKYSSDILGKAVAPSVTAKHVAAVAIAALNNAKKVAEARATTSTHPASPWVLGGNFRNTMPFSKFFSFEGVEGQVEALSEAEGEMKIKYEGKQFSVSEARMDESGLVSAILREDGAEYAGEKLVARVVATSRHGEGQTYTVFNKASTEDVKKSVSLLIPEPEYLRAEEGAGGAGGVAAPMPGKIIKTLIAPGTEVKKGTPLLIMEAMKMEHTIVAPTDGKIEDFTVAEGDFVDDGKVLVEFDGE